MVKKFISSLEIDKAIILTSSSTIARTLGGFILSILIAVHFTEKEQGVYFTFISITSIQLFFELGLGSIIIQFVAHEMPKCKITSLNIIEGDDDNISRMASLLIFCLRWYLTSSILLAIILIVFGSLYFTNSIDSTINIIWKPQWIGLALVVSTNLFFSFIIPFFQGMGKIEEMAEILLKSQIVSLISVLISINIGLKLEIPAISLLTSLITLIILVGRKGYYSIFKQLIDIPIKQKISYRKEIFPLQAKTSISWASGYLLNYSFTPIIFSTMGAIPAGKFGLTLSVIKAISAFTLSWVNTKIPIWSGLINKKRFDELNSRFRSTIKSSTIVSILITLAFILFISTLERIFPSFTDRFLPLRLIIIWSICIPLTNILDGMATKIRCYKQEPYSLQALALGIIITSSAYIATKFFNNLSYFIIAYTAILYFINLPWSVWIFIKKSKKYDRLYMEVN